MNVEVGQFWQDKDSRMQNRRVKVMHVDPVHGWVRYRPCNPETGWVSPAFEYRSMLKRFPKAFRPYEPQQRGGA